MDASVASRTRPVDGRVAVVWIDSREAILVRWVDRHAEVERMESDVPAHHRATGHVRHDPSDGYGGGGPRRSAGEPHRLEHLARFIDDVAGRLPARDDLVLLGPGTVREHLERHLKDLDARHRVDREIRSEAARRMTDRQLVAVLRSAMGEEPRRRTIGAYRWSDAPRHAASGHASGGPRRVVEKAAHRPDDEALEA